MMYLEQRVLFAGNESMVFTVLAQCEIEDLGLRGPYLQACVGFWANASHPASTGFRRR